MLFDKVLTGDVFRVFMRPCIYAWYRSGQCLYVGSSRNGISRCFQKDHHVLKLDSWIDSDDEVKLFFPQTKDPVELLAVEKLYIRELKPLLNKVRYENENIRPKKV